jgi:replicative DNA helicase
VGSPRVCICSLARRTSSGDQVDVTLLRLAAAAWQLSAQRLALIEGSGRLTVAQVRTHALQAMHLHSPVLALSSQNRGVVHYGKGSAALDFLKESGDLEYAADAILFLVETVERPVLPLARAVDLVVAKNR